MRDPLRELEHLGNLAAADPAKRFGKLYRLVSHRELLRHAGERVRQNTGGRTAGIDGQTRRQIDEGLCARLAEELAHNQYHPQAVRRAYIPKGKTGRRALGIPTIRDRIVQAVVAQILEAIYEPIFRNCSYGFRPQRNTIQALRHVAQAYQAGATWVIEGDLVKCFDSIPHGVILNSLRKRIKDERFIELVRKMLTAGVMAEGNLLPTYSGTPQGGLASPILSNVALHEFDCWLEEHWQANPPPLTAKQQHARANREYARHKRNLVRWRAQLHGRIPMGRQTLEGLRAKIMHALAARKRVPSVTPRRILSYCRYADDYVGVLCQHTKAEAQHLKAAMAQWLEEHLGLTQHPEKTCLTHWDDRFRFLGDDLRGPTQPERDALAAPEHPTREGARRQGGDETLVWVHADPRTRPVHEHQCAPARVDKLLPLGQQRHEPLPVSDRSGVLAHRPLPGAQTSLFHQAIDAHPLQGGPHQW
jgi:group II intron reverse transcriptase/maturase